MSFEIPKETNSGKITEVVLGATPAEGGTRSNKITIGGWNSLQCLDFEGSHPHKAVIAMEVYDKIPAKFPNVLRDYFGSALNKPADMAKKCVDEYGAEMISIRLESTHPEKGNTSVEEAAEIVKSVLTTVAVPLIITGHNNYAKNNELMKKMCEVTAGENCLINWVETDNYKTIAAACIAYNHTIVAQTPIDVNLAKQLNILLNDMSFPQDKIVMDSLTGALGYGLEYTYSIMERIVNDALAGDKMLAYPMIVTSGRETSMTKENRVTEAEYPDWGDLELRAAYWEIATAMSLFTAGGDLIVMQNPKAVQTIKKNINEMFVSKEVV
jgi:acetyl-CoA decarbonylase/synthase complex subunit delta